MNRKGWAFPVLLAATIVLPLLVTDRYYMHILISCALYAIVASSLNLVVGYTGYISFGHNALYAIGAYGSALIMQLAGWPFWISLPAATAMAGAAGLLVGYLPLRLRLKGPYFALVTMAFGLVIVSVIHNWVSLTGGPLGLTSIPAPDVFGFKFTQRRSYYYLVLFFAWATLLFTRRLMNSRTGRTFLSIREDEEMAETIGINVVYYKVLCFTISAALTGIAGALYAHYSRFLGPDMFSIMEATDMLIMVIIGGMGTLVGPVVGAVVIVILPEVLRGLAEYRQVFYSILLIVTIMFIPKGSVGLWKMVLTKIRGAESAGA